MKRAGMADQISAPTVHIRRIETRIEQQRRRIVELDRLGQDCSDARRILGVLEIAMKDMRMQLAILSPTLRDAKREKSHPERRASKQS